MKAYISSEVLAQEGLTLKDFGILLYYIDKGLGDICPEITSKLWEKNLLIKEIDGYSYNAHSNKRVQEWLLDSSEKEKPSEVAEMKRLLALADKLREIYPAGTKDGKYSWRDNTVTVAKKLKALIDKFNCEFTDEEAIEATKKYVDRFKVKGDFQYMQLLKYFILKRDNDRIEETSTLLTMIQNQREAPDVEDNNGVFAGYDTGELR